MLSQSALQSLPSAARSCRFLIGAQQHIGAHEAEIKLTANDARRNILVVDDESQITRVLRTTLSGRGYRVRTAADGDEALEVMRQWPPDLIITDLSMPNMGGLELCRRIRSKSAVPIIVLSVFGEEKTKIEAFDLGADDYVTKPFNVNELMARVRSGLRRASAPTREEDEKRAAEIDVGHFSINLLTRVVRVRGQAVHLTPKEFDLLCYLTRNPGKVITHKALLSSVWGEDGNEQPEYLHVFMSHLRKKLEPEDGAVRYITTERWVGYRFEPGDPQ
jgi:two-component system KDP operon response regulator KdpE